MPLQYGILTIIAIINLFWAVYIFKINPKDKINIFFSLSVFFCSLWAALFSFMDPVASTPEAAISIKLGTFIFGLLSGICFFIFSYYFPFSKKPFTLGIICHIAASLIVSVTLLFSGLVVIGAERSGNVWNFTFDPRGYGLISLYVFLYFGFAFYNILTSKLFGEKKLEKRVFVVFIGTLVAASAGVLCTLVLPYFWPITFAWVGPYFTIFMVAYISYYLFIKKRR